MFHSYFFLVIINFFKLSKLRSESWANDSSKNRIYFLKGNLFQFNHGKSVFRRKMCCLKGWWHIQDGEQSIPKLFQKRMKEPLWTMMFHILFSTTTVFSSDKNYPLQYYGQKENIFIGWEPRVSKSLSGVMMGILTES